MIIQQQKITQPFYYNIIYYKLLSIRRSFLVLTKQGYFTYEIDNH